jgi:hypothetical protein
MSTVPHRPTFGLALAASIFIGVIAEEARAETAPARVEGQASSPSAAAGNNEQAPPSDPSAAPSSPAPPTTSSPGAAPAKAAPLAPAAEATPDSVRPPPLHVEYVQYGVAVAVEMNVSAGATCPEDAQAPCILGSGGGLAIRLGYRAPGPWYVGGAYEFIKMDSSNLYRLGIFQQLRAELRYLPDIGLRAAPYVTVGLGGMAYGNEWGVETGGGLVFAGAGVEIEVSRTALLGVSFVYRPVLIAPWRDTAGQQRDLGVAQFIGFDFLLEIRTEIGRR